MPQDAEFDSADFARLLHQNKYRLVAKKGEGTFSEVLKAQSTITGEYFAIKCMKSSFKNMDQVNSLREIQALRRLNPHPNIIDLEEVLYDKGSGRLALVFELMDQNVYELIRGRKQPVKPATVKLLMYQLLKAVAHMHKHGIFHRDIKPENVLIVGDHYLKVADFGSCRGIYTQAPYTEYISTRWYRAPECLLTNGYYDYKMDCWGIGAVMFEVISLFPLFPGTNELDQVEKIHNILGTPPPEMLEKFKMHSSHIKNFNFPPQAGTGIARLVPHASSDAIDLMEKLLAYNPEHRITARQALRHPYFKDLRDAEKRERAIRTASPKLGRSLHTTSRGGAADGGAEEPEKDETTTTSKKKAASKSNATGTTSAAAASAADSSSKKFPSILPANSTTSNAASSSVAASSHATGSTASVTSMPHLHPVGGITANGGGGGFSSPEASRSPSDSNAGSKKKPPKKRAPAPPHHAPPATHAADDNASDIDDDATDADDVGDGGGPKARAAAAALKQKEQEKLKEMSLLGNASSMTNATNASKHAKSPVAPTLTKSGSQHKLHGAAAAGSTAYAQYAQQQQQVASLASNLSGGGGPKKSKSQAQGAVASSLPSIGGGVGPSSSVARATHQSLAHLQSSGGHSHHDSAEYTEYFDDDAGDGGAPPASHKKPRAKKKKSTHGGLGGGATSPPPIHAHSPQPPSSDHLTLSGQTAAMSHLHASASHAHLHAASSHKVASKSKTKSSAAGSLALAMQSIDISSDAKVKTKY